MQSTLKIFRSLLFLVYLPLWSIHLAHGETASHKAVLFYQPFCPACSAVIDDFLFPLTAAEGERLELFPIDTTEPPGDRIYLEVLAHFLLDSAVDMQQPAVLIGDQLLRGQTEIIQGLPTKLAEQPSPISSHWPDIPGLRQLIEGEVIGETQTSGKQGDPIASGLAWGMMFGMLLSLGYAATRLIPRRHRLLACLPVRSWSLPVFALCGLGIGIYLTSVTLTHNQAMCGPIGDCMSVQTSPHSILFGIPMALWGLLFYLLILILWLLQRFFSGPARQWAALGLLGFSLFGVAFSVYLTSLELFVIKAVCIWCLTSALLVTLIMLTVTLKMTCTQHCSAN
jgi:uncharacterized membrane protein